MPKEIKKKITKKETVKKIVKKPIKKEVVKKEKVKKTIAKVVVKDEPKEVIVEEVVEPKKTLGKSSYKNSKQKKKIQQKKLIETKKIIDKDRQLKVKIKHLEKELLRISKAIESGKVDKKNSDEKATIEKKLTKLEVEKKKIVKH